ncbi:hypothetical protein CYLTODRAFT_51801 [Cylindrobasidium torrendii FP15055 ss-10]|uniref:Uncharacterized protein n=1 Tax=Cylindrobasidium torrendii FP15055 ss-10 TaxID=1314674 RepID=A0A0D7B6N8_9AGAR|nr:hypothetical protein CYLTODRAFT_51801 [Cylindrobasidium torrendii FP15055 ss-10]
MSDTKKRESEGGVGRVLCSVVGGVSIFLSVYALATVDQVLGSSVQLSHGSFSCLNAMWWRVRDESQGGRSVSMRESASGPRRILSICCV